MPSVPLQAPFAQDMTERLGSAVCLQTIYIHSVQPVSSWMWRIYMFLHKNFHFAFHTYIPRWTVLSVSALKS